MSRKNLPFAVSPIVVEGAITGYISYVGGMGCRQVTLVIHCVSQSATDNVVEEVFRGSISEIVHYKSNEDTVNIIHVALALKEPLRDPVWYVKKLAAIIAKPVSGIYYDMKAAQVLKEKLANM